MNRQSDIYLQVINFYFAKNNDLEFTLIAKAPVTINVKITQGFNKKPHLLLDYGWYFQILSQNYDFFQYLKLVKRDSICIKKR